MFNRNNNKLSTSSFNKAKLVFRQCLKATGLTRFLQKIAELPKQFMPWQFFVFRGGGRFKPRTFLGSIMACPHKENCSFYEEFSRRRSLVWLAMVRNYCEDGSECERVKMYSTQERGKIPAELMPSGTFASKAFLSLL
jgi:hypothetical protein